MISFSVGITILIYTVLICVTVYAIKMEYTDLRCPTTKTHSKHCGPGKGAAYYRGRPFTRDTPDILLDKISLSGGYENNAVKWRRCLIFSLLVTLIIFLLVFTRLPSGKELLICVLVLYCCMYFMLSFYQNQISRYATRQIDVSLDLLRDKIF